MAFKVTIGQYYNADSVIHKLDARVKINLTFFFMIVVFFANNPVTNLLLAAFLLAVIGLSRIPVKTVIRSIKPIVPFLVLTALLNLFFIRTGEPVFSAGFITITNEAVRSAVLLSARFFFLLVGGTLMSLTTSPIELTDAVERLLAPLERIGVPSHEIAMMLSIALRFIPTLATEAERIIKAQQSRGASFDEGSLFKRIRLFVPIVVPLFASSIRHAENLAMAMEARCYEGGEGRTHYHVLKVGTNDFVAIGVFVVFVVCLFAARILL